MTTFYLFLIFIPILGIILISLNFFTAQHKPYKDKDSQFECGFISFVQMSRMAFTISFFIYALLFLLFDLEILLVYPYVVSSYNNDIYGLIIMLLFFLLLTIGFVYELGTKALQIDSRQTTNEIKPHLFSKNLLRSASLIDLTNIIVEITAGLTQTTDFVNQFNSTVITSNINVITDATGNLSVSVLDNTPDEQVDNIIKRIRILDRLINTKTEEISGLVKKGIELENGFKASDPNFKSELTEKILELKKLRSSYKHFTLT